MFHTGIQSALDGLDTSWSLQFILLDSGVATLCMLLTFAVLDGFIVFFPLIASIVLGPAAGSAMYVSWKGFLTLRERWCTETRGYGRMKSFQRITVFHGNKC